MFQNAVRFRFIINNNRDLPKMNHNITGWRFMK